MSNRNDFESGINRPFPGAPVSVSDFFRGSIERLLQINHDYVLPGAWDTKTVKVAHFIDNLPPRGEYYYAYSLFDNAMQDTTLGLIMTKPRAVSGLRRIPTESFRRYTYSDALGAVAMHYEVRGNHLEIARNMAVTELIEGYIEDPSLVDDPLDNYRVHALKTDIEALRQADPLKPMSNQIHRLLI